HSSPPPSPGLHGLAAISSIHHPDGGITVPHRHHSVLRLTALALALAAAPALAAKPAPAPLAVPDRAISVTLGSHDPHPAACEVGTLGPPNNAYGYVLPPDDKYATLLDPAHCGACAEGRFVLTVAHVQLFFTESCQIPVSVYVIPAYDQGGGCLAPQWDAPALCQPAQYLVSDGGILNECLDFGLTLPADCCVDRPVVLVFEFDQGPRQ